MCWGSSFLNNRYHDPTLGVFISVDPLVTETLDPYSYGANNPITYSDPTGLCVQQVFDYCVDGGRIDDTGTTRIVPVTKLTGLDVGIVENTLNLLQVDDPDARAGTRPENLAAYELFDRAVKNGTVVANPDGGYQLGSCAGEGWCDVYWASAISETLLGVRNGVLDDAINMQVITSGAMLSWPTGGATSATAGSTSAYSHEYTYSPRIRARGLEDPTGHNFPYSFDDVVLRSTPITQPDGSLLYRSPGTVGATQGYFEVGVNPSTGVIFHRTFTAG